jgi:mono/diheme cytochrome c family protein
MSVNLLYFFIACAALMGCERAPSTSGMKEWSPADHDPVEPLAAAPANAPGAAPPQADGSESAMLASLLWKQQCATCHGPTGRGDGPAAVATRPANLAAASWQSATSDAQIAKAITSGKGKMPKFELPEAVVKALVVHIRTFGKTAPR